MTHEEQQDRRQAGDRSAGRDPVPPPEEEYDHDDPADDAPRQWEGDPGSSQVGQVHRSGS
jgi:hypothetical protein